ncbi:MAG TPA: DUF2278 family protein [Mycobacteriales bacterium]|nr:DUF2278 family protein [Mycobacteriales bacterium]
MPIASYGVLSARAVERRTEQADLDSPHYQIHLVDDAGVHYRAAVNVKSAQQPPDLLYLAEDDFRHPVTAILAGLPSGWTPLPSAPGAGALDFIRANLLDPAAMRGVPAGAPGADNDLADLLDHHVLRAIADPAAVLYLYGQRWGPETVADKVFGFSPGNGVHDVHMNQGNGGGFARDNGVWQDGALLLHCPAEERWVGIFLAFQSQAWHTDDRTGNPLPTGRTGPSGPADPERVRIVAALVNPVGPAPERETVTLINASPQPVDLTGWALADQLKHTCPAGDGPLPPGGAAVVTVTNGVQLGNRGGLITLLDPDGTKADGVSYTGDQAHREGWTLVF